MRFLRNLWRPKPVPNNEQLKRIQEQRDQEALVRMRLLRADLDVVLRKAGERASDRDAH